MTKPPLRLMRYLYKRFILPILLLCLTACTQDTTAETKPMSLLMKKPVFGLEIDMFGPVMIIYINDVAIYDNGRRGVQLTTRFPANHLMHPKDNSIGMLITGIEDSEGNYPAGYRIKLTLTVYDHDNPNEQYTIASLDFKAKDLQEKGLEATTANTTSAGTYSSTETFQLADQGDVVVHPVKLDGTLESDDALAITLPITIPNSLPLWAFFNSDNIPDYNATNPDGSFVISEEEYNLAVADLHKEYVKIQRALEAEDIEPILPMFAERNREVDAAFYRKPGVTAAGIKEAFEESINDPELELAPLGVDDANIITENNLKLISLRRERGSAIVYDVKGGGHEGFPIWFRRENGQWILTR